VAWGRASRTAGYVFRPSTITDLRAVLALAQDCGRTVTFRAGGNTYGDAGANSENIVLSLTRMNRILEWDPRTGKITVEPGVTLQQMWQYILGDGWWIPIATGTMKTTVGGCAAMNTHGKNAWKVGHFRRPYRRI
jgi:decaprenylphospho-beta-D-ribofuranose 2-oxidase